MILPNHLQVTGDFFRQFTVVFQKAVIPVWVKLFGADARMHIDVP